MYRLNGDQATSTKGKSFLLKYKFLRSFRLRIFLIIMLIGKTTTQHREYRWSKEFALSHGMTFLNFVQHYPNRLDYISDRLHKYL